MKHLKNSLVVFAIALVVMGVVTSFIPSLTKGQKSADVPKSAFSVTTNPSEGDFNTVVSGPDPAGTSYAITSLTVTNLGISSELVILQGIWGNTSDCLSFPQPSNFQMGPLSVRKQDRPSTFRSRSRSYTRLDRVRFHA